MRLPRVRFTVRRMTAVVAVAAVVLVALPRTGGTDPFGTACPALQVEGEVAWVDRTNERVVLTIGSDDGLVTGFSMSLFRPEPWAQSLGQVRITSVGPDHAEGDVIREWSMSRVKVRVGDRVSLYPTYKKRGR